MMFLRSGIIAATFAGMMLAAGCQSAGTGPGSASATAGAGNAVVCDKCMRTWVKSPVTDKGRVVAYRNRTAKTDCPDCEAAAKAYFATGKLDDCKTCGADLHVSEPERM